RCHSVSPAGKLGNSQPASFTATRFFNLGIYRGGKAPAEPLCYTAGVLPKVKQPAAMPNGLYWAFCLLQCSNPSNQKSAGLALPSALESYCRSSKGRSVRGSGMRFGGCTGLDGSFWGENGPSQLAQPNGFSSFGAG